jgi:hypothetical protein
MNINNKEENNDNTFELNDTSLSIDSNKDVYQDKEISL